MTRPDLVAIRNRLDAFQRKLEDKAYYNRIGGWDVMIDEQTRLKESQDDIRALLDYLAALEAAQEAEDRYCRENGSAR